MSDVPRVASRFVPCLLKLADNSELKPEIAWKARQALPDKDVAANRAFDNMAFFKDVRAGVIEITALNEKKTYLLVGQPGNYRYKEV